MKDQRYVPQGNIVSSAGLTSGIDATLYVISQQLGDAVARKLIFGIFGILFFIVGMLKLGFDSQYSYMPSTGTMATILFAFILSVVGFFLGIIARKSSKGRGMAIAGITLTTLPVVVMIIIIGAGLVLVYT